MAGIGQYKPVRVKQYTATKNASGDFEESLAASYKAWAEVTDLSGGRSDERGKTVLSDTKQFKIHFRADWVLNGDWRIKYFGKEYTITKIERINEQRFNWLITASDKS